MAIDYQQWAQHTVAEARYGQRKSAVHIRIPAINVQAARQLFLNGDGKKLESHIDLREQPYQLHIFERGQKDGYITNVPLGNLREALWYLHLNEDVREELMNAGEVSFLEFLSAHNLPRNPGTPRLYLGHEKYGFFDLIQPGSFISQQIHRAVLYASFLESHSELLGQDIQQILPYSIWQNLQQGDNLGDAILNSFRTSTNCYETMHSTLEKMTLVVDGASSNQKERNLKVCGEHEYPVYWIEIGGRLVYRMINPEDIREGNILERLYVTPKEKCPICLETRLAA